MAVSLTASAARIATLKEFTEFRDAYYAPGEPCPRSGIYRCAVQGCKREAACVCKDDERMPPHRNADHSPRWQLIVATEIEN